VKPAIGADRPAISVLWTLIATRVLVVLVTTMLLPGRAGAQAWLPPQGEGAISVVYQDAFVKYHEFPNIGPVDVGHITSRSLLVDMTYGLTDNMAINVGIPWVISKYEGSHPHDLSGIPQQYWIPLQVIDGGTYHSTFQDFRLGIRYNLTKKWIVLTPFVGSTLPSHDYTYFAHSAAGRRLKELQVGVIGAKLLDGIIPGLFVQARYSYGVTERVLDVSHNRSNLDLELGYFLTPKLRLLELNSGQITHGGIDLPLAWRTDLGALAPHHDQVSRDNLLNIGGGATYALTDKVDIFGSIIHTVAARNVHMLDRGISLGLSWSFTTKRARDRAIKADHQYKCLCEKSAS
jgi:hypothetical protein